MKRLAWLMILVMGFSLAMGSIDGSSVIAQPKKPVAKKTKKKKKKPRTRAKPSRRAGTGTGGTARRTTPPPPPRQSGMRVTFRLPPNHGRIMKADRAQRAERQRIESIVDPRAIEAGNFALANRRQIRERRASYQSEQNVRNMRNTNRDAVRLDPDQLAATLRRQKAMEEAAQVRNLIERGERAQNARRGAGN